MSTWPVLIVVLLASQAATTPPSEPLWPQGAPGARGTAVADTPSIMVYLPPVDQRNGVAVVICPGGGYGTLALDHEGHQVARWLNSLGIVAGVLRYRVAPYRHPIPLLDAQRALRLVRHRAKDWRIDPNRVGILGFSAGGHLASTAATHFDDGKTEAADEVDLKSCRPDFAILVYPVISFVGEFTHQGSRNNLLGPDPDPELVKSLSNETQVTARTPPTFLVHTGEDKPVPPENSVYFYLALRKAGVPAELHIYEQGKHGLGLAAQQRGMASWPARCADWLRVRGILK